MAQSLEFSATDGMTLTATRCAVGAYTGTDAASVTQQSGTNRYLAVFTTEVSGAYRLDVKSAGTAILAEVYDLSGSGTFQPRTEQPNTTTPLTASGVRSALGLASANLDTQLSAIDDYLDTEIAAIKAKTDLLGTGVVSGSSPVTDAGEIDGDIIIGDDYQSANGRAFEWTVTAPTGFTLADCTCHFGGASGTKGSWNVTGTITDAGSGNWLLSFNLLSADTSGCSKGKYEWSVAVRDSNGVEITRVRSDTAKVDLVEKFT